MTDLTERAAALLGARVAKAAAMAGGDLADVMRVTLDDGRTIVAKTGPDPAGEGRMLTAMGAAGVPVPQVLAADDQVLVLSEVPAGGGMSAAAWGDLGRVVARLHAAHGDRYGWEGHYAFGRVRIVNDRSDHWPTFWAENRLRPFMGDLPRDLRDRVARAADAMPAHLPATPPPSLLHGDLWGGNILADGDRISGLIDPACYYGHGEVDLAMLALFARPGRAFWQAYGDLPDGWQVRRSAYTLFPALVHLTLFGAGYRGLVERCLDGIA